ncbi:hypothetical protein [Halomarina oriensis]|uniref:Uncharacterized protein n=1 Tax=Halomarina oriensis TaxID=671145 RepID=A0A6B0GNL8_9EURY|nr:hypothetical protein [Halomarina oriensis]MWG35109.1 hypothetical protein [Halomarina oriensis]
MRRVAVVVAVLLVVPLAGCGFQQSSPAAPDGQVTVTPAAVPTDAPTSTPDAADGIAPGVALSGAVDPVALAEAHREALLGASFTRETTRLIEGDETTLSRTDRTYEAAPYRVEFRYSQVQNVSREYPVRSFATRIDLYSNGSTTVARFEDDGAVSYRLAPTEQFSPIIVGITGNERVSALTSAFDFEVRDGPAPGTVLLVGETLKRPSALDPPTLTSGVRNATLTMLLTESGLVRSYRLVYDVTLDDRTLTVVETMQLSDIGRTRIERPPVVSTGRRERQRRRGRPGAEQTTLTRWRRSEREYREKRERCRSLTPCRGCALRRALRTRWWRVSRRRRSDARCRR